MAGKHKHIPVVYAPALNEHSTHLLIQDDEAHHLLHVLRVKPGQPVELTSGDGHQGTGSVLEIRKKQLTIAVQTVTMVPPPQPQIHLIVAPIRSNRLEWLVEKATELGIRSLQLVRTHHTAVPNVNTRRLERIAISALKQSRQAHLPHIHPLRTWEEWWHQWPGLPPNSVALVAHPDGSPRSLQQVVNPAVQHVYLWIGPEGGFHDEEIDVLKHHQFIPVTLGHSILRTETAAITALAQVNLLFL